MNTTDEDIQTLTNQINEWNVQLAILAMEHEAATDTVKQCVQKMGILRSKHHAATQQLRDLELHESGLYLWENIGCGG